MSFDSSVVRDQIAQVSEQFDWYEFLTGKGPELAVALHGHNGGRIYGWEARGGPANGAHVVYESLDGQTWDIEGEGAKARITAPGIWVLLEPDKVPLWLQRSKSVLNEAVVARLRELWAGRSG